MGGGGHATITLSHSPARVAEGRANELSWGGSQSMRG